MQNISKAYKEVWAAAMANNMGSIQRVDDGIEVERGLK